MKQIALMFRGIIYFIIFFSGFSSWSQETDPAIRIYKEIADKKLKAFVFADSLTSEPLPVIAFFHGGGWAFGSPSEFFGACRRYAAKGFVTISFEYRLAKDEEGETPHPDITPVECVKDARSAIRWLRSQAKELNIDPDQIIVGGQSVGGQLTLATALANNINENTDDLSIDPTPNAMLLYSGSVNTVSPWCDYLLGAKREKIWDISPYHNLKPGLPPTIAFHGKADKVVDYWTVGFFQRETEKLGNYFDLVPYEGRTHYLGESDEKGRETYSKLFDEEIMERTDAFLRKFGLMPGQ